MRKLLTAMSLTALSTAALAQPTIEELSQALKQQQAEIEALKSASKKQEERLEMAADSMGSGSASKTTIGGYGELHYNDLNGENGGKDTNKIDFHRFVLFVAHEFSEKTRLFSEFELEHALSGDGDGKPGEVELEQAYIEHDLTDTQKVRAGVVLVPVGILNETHEPNTFYGVERNNVEKNIIPTTWWEAGVAFNGELGAGLSYDFAITSGLNIVTPADVTADPSKAGDLGKVRKGRQKVANAKADDPATTARIKYTGVKGLELGLTLQYQADVAQSRISGESVEGLLTEAHAIYQNNGFGIRALYAQWQFSGEMNSIKSGAAKQAGFYLEPSYRITEQVGVFARYSEWDNRMDDKTESGYQQADIGVNYWIEPNVVFKFDYQQQKAKEDNGKEVSGINLGVGYSF